jgi:hypothetical protein
MTEPSTEHFEIGRPPAALEQIALELAFEALPPAERSAALAELLAGVARGDRTVEGLLAAWHDQRVPAAIWTEGHSGHHSSPTVLLDG